MESRPRSLKSTDRWDNGKKHQRFAGHDNTRTLKTILVFNISNQKLGKWGCDIDINPKHRAVIELEC